MRRKHKNKNVAGFLALFLGWMGAHKFYLGQKKQGWTFAALWGMAAWVKIPVFRFVWMPIAVLVALVEAVMLFAMDDKRFDEKYNGGESRQKGRDRSTDFERRDQSTDFERPRQEQHRPFPPHRRQRQEQRQVRHTKKAAARQNGFNKSGKEKFADYDYEGAIVEFKKSVETNPADVVAHFNLACAYSLTEKVDKAFYHLELAVAHGFRNSKKIQEHHALAYLRIQPEFESFVENGYRLPRKRKEEAETQEENLLASKPDLLDQLKKLSDLREQGLLTEKEFETKKEVLLQKSQ